MSMASWAGRRFWRTYAFFAILRILVAFTSTSVIHPDEHFQNPEVSAGAIFDYGPAVQGAAVPLRTWEWLGSAPVRSVVPLLLSTGPAFWLLEGTVGPHPSARMLFFAERAVMLLLSFGIDSLVYIVAGDDRQALLLLATSPISFTFLLRPFSNSLETLCLALILYASSMARRRSCRSAWLATCGAVAAAGCFVRVTFVAFAAPALLAAIFTGEREAVSWSFSRVIRRTALVSAGGFATAILCIVADEQFFLGGLTSLLLRLPLVTPANLLRYNLSSDNLSEHGLHPRYLHLLVNWPMLFGVGIVAILPGMQHWLVGDTSRDGPARRGDETALLLASILLPTLALSAQPHQEPRFLVPLVVPVAVLAAKAPLLRDGTRKGRRRRQIFWGAWLSHSIFFTLLFAYLHQGGLLPALFALNRELSSPLAGAVRTAGSIDLVFWRTFMPPRHLLLPLQPGDSPQPVIRVADLAGAPFGELAHTLGMLSAPTATTKDTLVLLVAPEYASDLSGLDCSDFMVSQQSSKHPFCLEPFWPDRPSFGVHIDMDRLDQVIASKGRVGVGVRTVKSRTEGDQ